MRQFKSAKPRLHVKHVRARSGEKREGRPGGGDCGETDFNRRLVLRRRRRRHGGGEGVHRRRVAVYVDRRARTERERGERARRRHGSVLVEPAERRIVADRERPRQVAHVLERHGSTARHCERARRIRHGVDCGGNVESFAPGVDRAAVRTNPNVDRCIYQAVIIGVAIDLDNSAVQNDRCRCGTLAGYAPRLERAAFKIQHTGGTALEARPLASRDRERAVPLRNRCRATAKPNLQIAAYRPVSTGLIHCERVEHHVALARDVRVRGEDIALVEVACLGRRDSNGAKE